MVIRRTSNSMFRTRKLPWAWRDSIVMIATAAAFGVAAYFCINLTRNGAQVAAFWPANGILLASVLAIRNSRARTATLVLCYVANVAASGLNGDHWSRMVVFSAMNIGHVVLAFTLLRKFVGRQLDFSKRVTVVRFLLIGCLVAPILPALGAATLLALFKGAPFALVFETRFLALGLGVVVMTPACLTLLSPQPIGLSRGKEFFAHFAFLCAVLAVVFGQSVAPLLFLLIPVLVMIAVRLGPRAAAFGALVTASAAIVCTYADMGPLVLMQGASAPFKVFTLQLFCSAVVFTSLVVAATVAERDALRSRNDGLLAAADVDRRKLDAALSNMTQGLCMFDSNGNMIMRNQRFLELYRLQENDAPLGVGFLALMQACARAGIAPQGTSSEVDLRSSKDFDQQLADGRHIRIAQRPLEDGTLVCTYTDVSSDRCFEEELKHITLHDALTDLPNRRLLGTRIGEAFARARQGDRFALLLLDVDHFKAINDTHGHAAGDAVLMSLAKRLRNCVRECDLVARLGGDEFAILLDRCAGPKDVAPVASRILGSCDEDVMTGGRRIPVSLSIGVAFAPADAATSDTLFHAADVALYRTKKNGRNGLSYSSEWGSGAICH